MIVYASKWNMRDSCGSTGEAAEKLTSHKNPEVFLSIYKRQKNRSNYI